MNTTIPSRVPVQVTGDGAVAELLRGTLTDTERPLVVAIGLDRDAGEPVDGQRAALGSGREFLPVRMKGLTVEIGPLARPGRPGCVGCAHLRHRAVVSAAPMHARLADEGPRIALPAHWARMVADLVAHRIDDGLPAATVQVVALARRAVSEHTLTPHPDCPHCAGPPDDAPDAGRFAFVPRRQPEPDRLRVRPAPELDRLTAALVDHRFGPVVQTYRDAVAPLAFTGAEVAMPGGRRSYGYGRSLDYTDAKRVALLEAVERESGSIPTARRTVVRGAHRDLPGPAVDPVALGLPDPAYDGHRASLLTPYTPDTETTWVWGHDHRTGQPVLVPEHVAYYGLLGDHGGPPAFTYECSNGCAVGSCLEEAILYGCLEVVERDAFLMSWYSRTPGARLRPGSVRDPVSVDLLARAAGEGYEVRLHDITGDVGLPVVWALALDPDNPDGASLSAAGAHPDPEKAVRAALVEVLAMIVLGRHREPESAERRRAMFEDPTRVVTMDDHVALYTLPESLDRLGWLLDDATPPEDVGDRHGDWRARWVRPDLTDSMHLVVDAMTRAGVGPVTVRQSSARDRALDLEVVKVLAPGALAVTFGHVHHRTRGLPRLDAARRRSGVSDPVLPHPFP